MLLVRGSRHCVDGALLLLRVLWVHHGGVAGGWGRCCATVVVLVRVGLEGVAVVGLLRAEGHPGGAVVGLETGAATAAGEEARVGGWVSGLGG